MPNNDIIEVKGAKCPFKERDGMCIVRDHECIPECMIYSCNRRSLSEAIQTCKEGGMEVYPKGTLAEFKKLLLEAYHAVCKSDLDEEAVIEARWGEEVFRLLGGVPVDIKQINKGNTIPCPSCSSVDCIGYVHSGVCNSVQLIDLTDWKARAEKAEARIKNLEDDITCLRADRDALADSFFGPKEERDTLGGNRVLRALERAEKAEAALAAYQTGEPSEEQIKAAYYAANNTQPFDTLPSDKQVYWWGVARVVLSCPPNPEYVAVKRKDLKKISWLMIFGEPCCSACKSAINECDCWLGNALNRRVSR